MAQTTLVPKIPLRTEKVNSQFKKSSKSLLQTQKSVVNINSLLKKRIKVRNELFSNIFESKRRREYETRRMELEDERESRKSVVSGAVGNIAAAVSKTGGSLIGRLMKSLGFIVAGWILRSLPTWIGYAKEFIARISELGRIIRSFITNVGNIFQSSINVLSALKDNILKFDFFDSQRNLKNSFDELGKSIEGVQKDFEDTINVFTTDLTKEIDGVTVGSYSGEAIPEPGQGFTEDAPSQTQTYDSGSSSSAPSGVFELIAGGEGGYESMNRGNAGDSPGGAKKYLGKNLQDMTLSEIMNLQSQGKVFAVGKYQIIDKTMPGFVKWLQAKGYDPKTTKYDAKIQDMFPEYVVNVKRPTVGKYLRGESGISVEDATQELAREFASVGLSKPEAGRVRGQSRYAGTAGNRASISPEQVEQALRKARESGGNITTKSTNQTKVTPLSTKIPTLYEGESAGARSGTHMGRDIATDAGTALIAFTDGTIVQTGVDGGYGNYIVWKDSSGVEHLYGHMLEKPSFSAGQKVSKGTVIGRVGSTGRSTGPHLHWEISPKIGEVGYKRSNPIDPLKYGFSKALPFAQKVSSEDIGKNILGDTQTPSQAQISSSPAQQAQQQVAQQITPERKAQDIVAVVPQSSPQQPAASQGSGPSQQQSAPSMGEVLNNFMKQKFLLDLSFL